MRKIIAAFLMIFCITAAPAVTFINDTETENLLAEIIAPIATAADIEPSRVTVHIVHDDDFNAFVMGGTDVYIYTGLLTRVKNPASVMAVVAHEMGHTIGGHITQMSARASAEMRRSLLIQALGIGLMAASGEPSLGAGVLAGAGGIANAGMMSFSRDEERIADNLGLDLMRRAGYDPVAFVDVFEQMRDITGAMESRINPNRVNHPLTSERLQNVREYIAVHPGNYKSVNNDMSARYDLMRAKLIGYLHTPSNIDDTYPQKDKSTAAIYARTIAAMRAGNWIDAAAGARTLATRDAKNPYYQELLGDILFGAGDYDGAVVAYDAALRVAPSAPQIQTALALTLTARGRDGDAARALDLCRRANLTRPAPLVYWVMARAYGDDGRGLWAMAEYYNAMGNEKMARTYARRAQKKLPHDAPEFIKSGDILNRK
ncbi:M48 family metalloprotease [bacterium]|nr:M48 family metalloprotease [bacterium]